jgi:hypothetical protein
MTDRFERDLGDGWHTELSDGDSLRLLDSNGEVVVWAVGDELIVYSDDVNECANEVPLKVMKVFLGVVDEFFASDEYREAIAKLEAKDA